MNKVIELTQLEEDEIFLDFYSSIKDSMSMLDILTMFPWIEMKNCDIPTKELLCKSLELLEINIDILKNDDRMLSLLKNKLTESLFNEVINFIECYDNLGVNELYFNLNSIKVAFELGE